MYESRKQAPLTRRQFASRMIGHASAVIGLLVFSIALGMAGYAYFEDLPAADAFLNTAMLLGGMGPVNPPQSEAGKLFAGLFALYAGLIFIVAAALVLAPVMHRLLHRFHWQDRG
jgi:uncharacterized membrane protein YphA (DoxX/SURF4 family)